MLTVSALTPIWRSLLLAAANLMALLIYAFGLVAPLTPSEGSPSLVAILMFVGIPVAILAWCVRACDSRIAALFFGLQLVAVLGFAASLLFLQVGALYG
ncbi:MAG: hypothetical protein HOP23_09000 [Methylococcaceae bacterium]|nr:hypothetical protein [Methylococcaceae bacterium]